MEPIMIFALAVGFIGCFHLLSTAVTAFSKGRHIGSVDTTKRRNDWYCFFTLSSLYGGNGAASDNGAHKDLSQNANIEEQKRRQEAQRPRLYAE